jgi:hypothetical protein
LPVAITRLVTRERAQITALHLRGNPWVDTKLNALMYAGMDEIRRFCTLAATVSPVHTLVGSEKPHQTQQSPTHSPVTATVTPARGAVGGSLVPPPPHPLATRSPTRVVAAAAAATLPSPNRTSVAALSSSIALFPAGRSLGTQLTMASSFPASNVHDSATASATAATATPIFLPNLHGHRATALAAASTSSALSVLSLQTTGGASPAAHMLGADLSSSTRPAVRSAAVASTRAALSTHVPIELHPPHAELTEEEALVPLNSEEVQQVQRLLAERGHRLASTRIAGFLASPGRINHDSDLDVAAFPSSAETLSFGESVVQLQDSLLQHYNNTLHQLPGSARLRPPPSAAVVVTSSPILIDGKSIDDADAPSHFKCPITMGIMLDPVVLADGYTYDRTAIESWLRKSDRSPMTGARLAAKTITPNFTIRSMIAQWCQENARKV